MGNRVRDVEVRAMGQGHSVLIGVELPEAHAVMELMPEVARRFVAAKAEAPEDTRFMLISVVGDIEPAAFAQAWRDAISDDAAARALVGTLEQADVMQSDAEGRVLGVASLLTE